MDSLKSRLGMSFNFPMFQDTILDLYKPKEISCTPLKKYEDRNMPVSDYLPDNRSMKEPALWSIPLKIAA